jgi:hypothetical protein
MASKSRFQRTKTTEGAAWIEVTAGSFVSMLVAAIRKMLQEPEPPTQTD